MQCQVRAAPALRRPADQEEQSCGFARTRCVSLPAVAKNSRAFSFIKRLQGLLFRDPVHADDLIAAAFADGNGNGRTGYFEQMREEFYARLIGAAFKRRGGEREFECF